MADHCRSRRRPAWALYLRSLQHHYRVQKPDQVHHVQHIFYRHRRLILQFFLADIILQPPAKLGGQCQFAIGKCTSAAPATMIEQGLHSMQLGVLPPMGQLRLSAGLPFSSKSILFIPSRVNSRAEKIPAGPALTMITS